jgi:hypothetical protein
MLRGALAVNSGFRGLVVATTCPAGVVDNGVMLLVGVEAASIVILVLIRIASALNVKSLF